MKHRTRLAVFCLLAAAVVICSVQPLRLAQSQGGEPRFSFPSARRFAITSYFDHTHPDVLYNTIDDEIAAYTTERGLRSNNCFDCFWSGTVQVCGYYTVLQDAANCGAAGGRRVYYDMHPAIDYGFPLNTAIAAAAPGTALQRDILGFAVVIDHGNDYFTKHGHVDRNSRIAHNTQVIRGQQIALSSNTGTGAAHLHFEARYSGEDGIVFDPYGWRGPWYTDPWNQPSGHTESWWRSGDPIPMGYRDQNHNTQGPYQLTGVMESKWYELNGLPGSPIGNRGSNNCPGTYGDCQFFERGYLRWDYINNVTLYYDYASTVISQVFYFQTSNWNTTLSIQNISGVSAQVSVIFVENGRVVDSRTYLALPSGSTWVLSAQHALQDMTSSFAGAAEVYSNQTFQITVAHQPAFNNTFVSAIMNNY